MLLRRPPYLAARWIAVPSRKFRIQAIRQGFGEIGAEPDIPCEMSNYVDADLIY